MFEFSILVSRLHFKYIFGIYLIHVYISPLLGFIFFLSSHLPFFLFSFLLSLIPLPLHFIFFSTSVLVAGFSFSFGFGDLRSEIGNWGLEVGAQRGEIEGLKNPETGR